MILTGKIALQTKVCGKEKNKLDEKKQKTDCKCDSAKLIRGIVCDVQNCAYHSGKSECYAGSICVGPKAADCSANTSCATFKPREY